MLVEVVHWYAAKRMIVYKEITDIGGQECFMFGMDKVVQLINSKQSSWVGLNNLSLITTNVEKRDWVEEGILLNIKL